MLSPEQVERISGAPSGSSRRRGSRSAARAAREVYRRAGAIVDDATQMVRLGRDIVEAHSRTRRSSFVLHARNPERHLHVGGNVVNFGPVNGAPHITDLERGRRYGDIEAFRNILQGHPRARRPALAGRHRGRAGGPAGADPPSGHVPGAHRVLRTSSGRRAASAACRREDAIAMSAIEHGCTIEELAARPTLMTVTNVNSPRRVDEEILDNIMVMAAHGQCVVITPFTLMGAMAPVTLAGALVQQTAEALGVIALCQMIRPGAPASWAASPPTSTCAPARRPSARRSTCNAVLAGAQIGRRLKTPGAHQRGECLAGGRCAVDLRDRVLAAGRDPEPQPPDQPCGRLARGRAVGLAGEDRRRRRNAAQLGRDAEAGRASTTTTSRSMRSRTIAAGGHFFGSRAHARPLRVRVLPPAAVGLVELRELDATPARATRPSGPPASGRSCSPNTAAAARPGGAAKRSPTTWRAARRARARTS